MYDRLTVIISKIYCVEETCGWQGEHVYYSFRTVPRLPTHRTSGVEVCVNGNESKLRVRHGSREKKLLHTYHRTHTKSKFNTICWLEKNQIGLTKGLPTAVSAAITNRDGVWISYADVDSLYDCYSPRQTCRLCDRYSFHALLGDFELDLI